MAYAPQIEVLMDERSEIHSVGNIPPTTYPFLNHLIQLTHSWKSNDAVLEGKHGNRQKQVMVAEEKEVGFLEKTRWRLESVPKCLDEPILA